MNVLRRLPKGAVMGALAGRWLPWIAAAMAVGLTQTGLPASTAETNLLRYPALAEMARSARALPFSEVIFATTGRRVLSLETNNPAHDELRRKILQAASLAGERARRQGLSAARANEAGNQIGPLVRAALIEAGLAARVPTNVVGRAQATGYPDLEITAPLPCYLELKTYNATTANTTQRSFYYSPSASPKITRDALHLLLAFELERAPRDGQTAFVPVRWKLLTLENLTVDLKFEFNQSNRGLYGQPAAILGEGRPAEK